MIAVARLPDARLPSEEWLRLAAAAHRLLLVDFDGTLAPLVVERATARALPGAMENLSEIASRRLAAVGVLSGRPIDELERLAPDPALRLVGEHGWEERLPDGRRRAHEPSPAALALLDVATRQLSGLVDPSRLERKRTALVVHTRDLAPSAATKLLDHVAARWSEISRRAEVRLHRIDGGCELRSVGHSKGTAVEAIRRQLGGEPFTVCLGDDETDEDAFRVVAGNGLGIVIGAGERATLARARLPDPHAVAEYLSHWLARFPASAVPS